MTISLTLEAADVAALQRMCAELAHNGAPPAAVAAIAETAQAVDYVTKDSVARDAPIQMGEARTTNKKSKKAQDGNDKAAPSAQPAEVVPQTAVSPPAADTSAGASIDDVREKFRALSSAQGLPAVTAILHTFKTLKDGSKKVERMSDLAPSDFAAVIAKVDAALK